VTFLSLCLQSVCTHSWVMTARLLSSTPCKCSTSSRRSKRYRLTSKPCSPKS